MKMLYWAGGVVIAACLVFFWLVPAFRGDLVMDPVLQVGSFQLHYYGLIMGLAILTSYYLARVNSWRFGIGQPEVDRLGFWLIIICFLSARLYFVLFEWEYFSTHAWEIPQIWRGGLSMFGAILGGLLFLYFYAQRRAFTFWQAADLIGLVLPLGQAIGRFGNFVNYEAYGSETNLPWRMYVPEPFRLGRGEFYHPTFLYEAIGNLVLFGILFWYKGRLKPGNLAAIYLLGYSALRFFIEPLRLDSTRLGGLRLDQIIALLLFVAAVTIYVKRYRINKHST
jgi:phosphatidylglycerol---prolipoprotein diacylglyceryl transferase